MLRIAIKSGTSGYMDYDHNDWVIAELPSTNIPSVGDKLIFGDNNDANYKDYLVTGVERTYNRQTATSPFAEWIMVYVVLLNS